MLPQMDHHFDSSRSVKDGVGVEWGPKVSERAREERVLASTFSFQ
jgi:hypothetical protein